MGWYCVHVEHQRLSTPLNTTFRNMVLAEYRKLGEPVNCRVYRRQHVNSSVTYYFSPGAYETLAALVNFWHGTECPEPADHIGLEVMI